jgi:hypothetical protein
MFIFSLKNVVEQSVSNSFDIDQLPEEMDDSAVVNLDITNLRQLLLNFEKKFNKNQMMRMKFSDNPEKFMDSEIELNVEINNLYTLAASPELYPAFINSGSLQSVMGMITHENTDISINTIGIQIVCTLNSYIQFNSIQFIYILLRFTSRTHRPVNYKRTRGVYELD